MRTLPWLALLLACGGDADPALPPAGTPPAGTPPPVVPGTPPAGPSLLLVTLDTTRADRIGAYGHAAAATPTLDALAAHGVRFERAYATVPLTTPAHASMLTGLYPTRHGVHNNGDAVLADDIETVTERLSGGGYRTAAAVSAFVTTRIWNLDQGFDAYFDDLPAAGQGGRWGQERAAGPVVDDLVGWLGADPDHPFFAWAHFYDPHHPHAAPAVFEAAHADPYDAEIAYMDQELGRLLAAAEAAAGPAGLHVVVLADHGEAFGGEHGEDTHGLFLFDPTMRIPFIVRPAAGLEGPVVSAATVSGVDVAPTVLGLLGLGVPAGLDGRDLSPAARGDAAPSRPVYLESTMAADRFGYAVERASVDGSLKLMDTPDARLYDLVADPGETRNLLSERPTEVERLRAHVASVTAASAVASAGGAGPSAEVVQQLAELGYLSTDFTPDARSAQIDAKTRSATLSTLEALRAQLRSGADPTPAVAAYRALVAAEPQLAEARMGLARALSATGDDAGAEAVYRDALERQPHSAMLKVNLANAIAAQGRHAEGLALMEAVLVQVPDDTLARIGALRLLTDLGRLPEAAARAERWRALAPGDLGLQAQLGVIRLRQGEVDAAEPLLRASLGDGVPRQLVHKGLGHIARRRGQPRRAMRHFELESQAFPGDAAVLLDIASLHIDLKDWEAGLAAFQRVLDADPSVRLAWLGRAQCRFNLERYADSEADLRAWLDQHPDDPDFRLLRANALAKLDRRAEAEAELARARALHAEREASPRP